MSFIEEIKVFDSPPKCRPGVCPVCRSIGSASAANRPSSKRIKVGGLYVRAVSPSRSPSADRHFGLTKLKSSKVKTIRFFWRRIISILTNRQRIRCVVPAVYYPLCSTTRYVFLNQTKQTVLGVFFLFSKHQPLEFFSFASKKVLPDKQSQALSHSIRVFYPKR